MNEIDDMTEKRIHDLTEGHEFTLIEPGATGVVPEYPFRGPDMPMDYRQPGFAFLSPSKNVFVSQWKSFVQGVECQVPDRFTAPDGYVLGVRLVVKWEFKSRANVVPPSSPPSTRKYASGPYTLLRVNFICASTMPPAEPIAYDGNYDSGDVDIFGNRFKDTETIVAQLGLVADGKLIRTIPEGNLFLSRFSRGNVTALVLNP